MISSAHLSIAVFIAAAVTIIVCLAMSEFRLNRSGGRAWTVRVCSLFSGLLIAAAGALLIWPLKASTEAECAFFPTAAEVFDDERYTDEAIENAWTAEERQGIVECRTRGRLAVAAAGAAGVTGTALAVAALVLSGSPRKAAEPNRPRTSGKQNARPAG